MAKRVFDDSDFAEESPAAAGPVTGPVGLGTPGPYRAGYVLPAKRTFDEADFRPSNGPKETNAAEAALLGGGKAASFGFNDELGGLAGAVLDSKVGKLVRNLDLVPESVKSAMPFLAPPTEVVQAQTKTGQPIANPELQAEENKSFGDRYRENRDEIRRLDSKAAEEHPVAYYGTNIATSIAAPSLVGKVKAVGLLGRGKQLAAAAAEGAGIALGNSEADLTKGEYKQAAEDTLRGAELGAGANAAGQVVGKGVSALKAKVIDRLSKNKEELVDRILNEVSEGPTGLKTTPTKAKLVDKARDAIASEVIDGPDAKVVRDAFLSEAKDGLKELRPIIRRVGETIGGGYDKFKAADKDLIDTTKYLRRIEDAARDAARNGKGQSSDVLKDVASRFRKLLKDASDPEAAAQLESKANEFRAKAAEAAQAGDSVAAKELEALADQTVAEAEKAANFKPDLKTIRGFTTEAQEAAASAVGGLNLHTSARLKDQASAVTSEIMDDFLSEAARGDEALQKVADDIRKANTRYHALKTVEDALSLRQWKENTAESALVRTAKDVASSAALGGVIGGVSGDGDIADRATRAGLGALGGAVVKRALPAAATVATKWQTTAALQALQKLSKGQASVEEVRRLGVPERVVRLFLQNRQPPSGDQQ